MMSTPILHGRDAARSDEPTHKKKTKTKAVVCNPHLPVRPASNSRLPNICTQRCAYSRDTAVLHLEQLGVVLPRGVTAHRYSGRVRFLISFSLHDLVLDDRVLRLREQNIYDRGWSEYTQQVQVVRIYTVSGVNKFKLPNYTPCQVCNH